LPWAAVRLYRQESVEETGTTMLSTVDTDLERHRETWIGFCRFVKIMTTVIVLILIGMAIFLL
jgi:hypothetical protein